MPAARSSSLRARADSRPTRGAGFATAAVRSAMDVIARLRKIHAGPLDLDLHVGALLPEALSIVRAAAGARTAAAAAGLRAGAPPAAGERHLAARGRGARSMYSRTEEDCREKACAVCTRGRASRASRHRRRRAASPQFASGNIRAA